MKPLHYIIVIIVLAALNVWQYVAADRLAKDTELSRVKAANEYMAKDARFDSTIAAMYIGRDTLLQQAKVDSTRAAQYLMLWQTNSSYEDGRKLIPTASDSILKGVILGRNKR